jgi:hypothetical protein
MLGAIEEIVTNHLGGNHRTTSGLTTAQVEALERTFAKQLMDIRGLVSGSGVVRFRKWHLDGVESCKGILTRSGVAREAYE